MDSRQTFEMIFVVLGTFGGFLNVTSLLYFLRKERHGLSNHLLILLISVDLTLCTCLPFVYVCRTSPQTLINYYAVMNFLIQTSGMVTTTLSVVRTISIRNPLRDIRESYVWYVIVLFFGFSLGSNIYTAIRKDKVIAFKFGIGVFGVCMMVVLTSGVLSYRFLKTVRIAASTTATSPLSITSRRYKASVTILILVAVFCATNTVGFVLAPFLYFIIIPYVSASRGIQLAAMYLDVFPALNSILNPIVYIVRKGGLRHHVRQTIKQTWHVMATGKRRTRRSTDGYNWSQFRPSFSRTRSTKF